MDLVKIIRNKKDKNKKLFNVNLTEYEYVQCSNFLNTNKNFGGLVYTGDGTFKRQDLLDDNKHDSVVQNDVNTSLAQEPSRPHQAAQNTDTIILNENINGGAK